MVVAIFYQSALKMNGGRYLQCSLAAVQLQLAHDPLSGVFVHFQLLKLSCLQPSKTLSVSPEIKQAPEASFLAATLIIKPKKKKKRNFW
jgi:hypothetical protein